VLGVFAVRPARFLPHLSSVDEPPADGLTWDYRAAGLLLTGRLFFPPIELRLSPTGSSRTAVGIACKIKNDHRTGA
jgi:hypothetical protein